MTFFFEVSRGWNWKPGYHRGPATRRIWWGWFAAGVVVIPWDEFVSTPYEWEE